MGCQNSKSTEKQLAIAHRAHAKDVSMFDSMLPQDGSFYDEGDVWLEREYTKPPPELPKDHIWMNSSLLEDLYDKYALISLVQQNRFKALSKQKNSSTYTADLEQASLYLGSESFEILLLGTTTSSSFLYANASHPAKYPAKLSEQIDELRSTDPELKGVPECDINNNKIAYMGMMTGDEFGRRLAAIYSVKLKALGYYKMKTAPSCAVWAIVMRGKTKVNPLLTTSTSKGVLINEIRLAYTMNLMHGTLSSWMHPIDLTQSFKSAFLFYDIGFTTTKDDVLSAADNKLELSIGGSRMIKMNMDMAPGDYNELIDILLDN